MIKITKTGRIANIINGIEIKGRLCTDAFSEWELFQRYVGKGNSYLEVGTLFGGSLIVAGLSCDGPLHCIDPLDGYYGKGKLDVSTRLIASPEIVMENIARFPEIDPERVTIHQQKSYPWPGALEEVTFDTGFVDGDHTYKGCLRDLENMKECITGHIIVDNVDSGTVRRACKVLDDWELLRDTKRIGVWKKP